jgi:hypothetical protein
LFSSFILQSLLVRFVGSLAAPAASGGPSVCPFLSFFSSVGIYFRISSHIEEKEKQEEPH